MIGFLLLLSVYSYEIYQSEAKARPIVEKHQEGFEIYKMSKNLDAK